MPGIVTRSAWSARAVLLSAFGTVAFFTPIVPKVGASATMSAAPVSLAVVVQR
jgi:hypothetical protein